LEGNLYTTEGASQQITLPVCPVGRLGIPSEFLSYACTSGWRETCKPPKTKAKGNAPSQPEKRSDTKNPVCTTTPGLEQFASQRPRIFTWPGPQVNRCGHSGGTPSTPWRPCPAIAWAPPVLLLPGMAERPSRSARGRRPRRPGIGHDTWSHMLRTASQP
jgi:hypothetical protein